VVNSNLASAEFSFEENLVSRAREGTASYFFEQLTAERIDESLQLEKEAFPNPWSRQLLIRELGKNSPLNIGISHRGRLVGQSFSMLLVDELHLLNLSIASKHRRQGLAAELLVRLLEVGKEMGASTALLEVRESNAVALGLYKGFGFRVISRRKAYYRDNGEDALVLRRSLTTCNNRDLEDPSLVDPPAVGGLVI